MVFHHSGGEKEKSLLSRNGVENSILLAESSPEAVKDILKESVEGLYLHEDLMVIWRRLKIHSKNGDLLYPLASSVDTESSFKSNFAHILTIFSSAFPTDTLAPKLEVILPRLDEAFSQSGDDATRLLSFLKEGIPNDNCQLMLALKLLSASILGPSVFLLRGVIYGKYPYTDLLDNWEVTVIINEQYDNHVEMSVIHSRKEKALIPEPNQYFEFDWKSTIVWTSSPFDIITGSFFREKDTYRMATNVTKLTFEEDTRLRYKRDIRDLLNQFVDSKNAYRLVWDRKLLVQPVHKDISRLSEKIKIVHEKEGVLYDKRGNEQETPGHIAVHEILTILAKYTGDVALQAFLKDEFMNVIKPGGDLSEQLFKLFKREDLFPDQSMMVKLLKCINQEMLSPGVMNLRANIYEKFPFKDIKGGWSVVFFISEKEYRVTHIKKEQSYETKEDGQFTFEWIVDIPFKKSDLENFAPVMSLSDYEINPKFPLKARKELLDFLLPIMKDQEMFKRLIYKRPLSKTSIGTEFVNFFKRGGITIVDADQCKDIYKKPEDDTPESEITAVTSFLVGTARFLKDDDAFLNSLETNIKTHVKGGNGLLEQVKAVVKHIDDNTHLARLLKGASFEAQFPVFLALRSAFSQAFPFKRVKGAAKISVSISALTDTVRIIHDQKEESASDDPTRYFEFEWQLTLELTKNTDKLTSNIMIKKTTFGDQTSQDIKPDLLAAWLGFNAVSYHHNIDIDDLF